MWYSCIVQETNARHFKSDYHTNNIRHLYWAAKAGTDVLTSTFFKWSAQCATALWPKCYPIPRRHNPSHVTFLWMRMERISEVSSVLCLHFMVKANHYKYVNNSDLALYLNSNFANAWATWALLCCLWSRYVSIASLLCHQDWDHSGHISSFCASFPVGNE